jgi:hypothetical protein
VNDIKMDFKERRCENVDCIHLTQDGVQCQQAFVNMVMKTLGYTEGTISSSLFLLFFLHPPPALLSLFYPTLYVVSMYLTVLTTPSDKL